jgi:signal transduction histidine kinase/ActR/RegA family two-component response regulator
MTASSTAASSPLPEPVGEDALRPQASNRPEGVFYRADISGGQPRRMTPATRALLGLAELTPEEALQEDWWHCVHPADAPQAQADYRAMLDGVGELDSQYRIRRVDSSVRWVRDRAAIAEFDEHGTPTAIFGMLEDVTRRIQREQNAQDLLEKYHTLFDSIDTGFCIIEVLFENGVGSDYRFIEINPAFERHTGLRDVVGRRMLELAPSHESFWFRTYGEIALTGEPARFEHVAQSMDRHFDVYAFRFGNPELCQVAVLFSDISQRKQNEQALRDNARRKTEFIATLAHELRNPLAPVVSGLQIVRMAGPQSEPGAKAMEMIDRQLGQMTHLLDDLLDINRINLGKVKLRMERIDLGVVVANTVQAFCSHYQDIDRHLSYTAPTTPMWVDADATRITQILGNLLSNAAKFTSPQGQVEIAIERENGHVNVRVRDDGIGIAPEQMEHIFELFAQVDSDQQSPFGGLGVGIALARELAQLHGGNLVVHSDGINTGAEFTLRLPALPAEQAAVSAPASRTAPEVPATLQVLVVDDNRDAADSIGMVMELLGHEVSTRYGGLEGFEAAQQLQPQVVFLDIGMPGLDGHEICRRLRAQPWGQAMRIIALTGWGAEEDRQRTAEAGFDFHLVKPVSTASLKDALTQVMSAAAE